MKPPRIQLKRTKGWCLPANTVVVSRPSAWGNPFVVESDSAGGWLLAIASKWKADGTAQDIRRSMNALGPWKSREAATAMAVEAFRKFHGNRFSMESARKALGGKGLACWCKLGTPCHADVLLEMAND